MRKRIFLRIFMTSVVALLISGIVVGIVFAMNKEHDIASGMKESLQIMLATGSGNGDDMEQVAERMQRLSNSRITIVASDGTVLGDSDRLAVSMENHGDRKEIGEAKSKGYAWDKRRSSTTQTDMLYVAVRQGDVIYRMARPASDVTQSVLQVFPPIVLALCAALIIALILSKYAADGATKPLRATVDALRKAPDAVESYDSGNFEELSPLIRTIGEMSEDITRTRDKLSTQRDQTRFILDNMQQGLIFVDSDSKVILANHSAVTLLGSPQETAAEGMNLIHLTREPKVGENVRRALVEGRSCMFDLDLRQSTGAVVSASVAPLEASWISGEEAGRFGAVILLTDVTSTRQMEVMRSEFIANVSHELKTPITSIKGFAELLSQGLVRDETKRREYLVRIRDESERMTSIIEDILKVSRLESEDYRPVNEDVDVLEVAKEAASRVMDKAQRGSISLSVTGESGIVSACREDIYQMVSNLIDNAVKYNRPGGYVKVAVRIDGSFVKLTVADNGIGISKEHQSRIFERFYRVDKGRSRKIGGTGLGLSIVKHVAASLGGELSLRSKEQEGTTISVKIKKAK